MKTITKLKINKYISIPIGGIISGKLNSINNLEDELELDISSIESLNRTEIKEFIFYYEKLTEIANISQVEVLTLVKDLNMISSDVILTLQEIKKSSYISPYLFISFIFYFILYKKNIKSEIKKRWAYSKILEKIAKIDKTFNWEEAVEISKNIKKYTEIKQSNHYKSMKQFYIDEGLHPQTFIAFQKYRKIYVAFLQHFEKE